MTISRRNCNRVINLYSMKLDVKSYLNGIEFNINYIETYI